jgi:hypothetical protein
MIAAIITELRLPNDRLFLFSDDHQDDHDDVDDLFIDFYFIRVPRTGRLHFGDPHCSGDMPRLVATVENFQASGKEFPPFCPRFCFWKTRARG